MAASKVITFRLQAHEQIMLNKCLTSNDRGDVNPSEFFRLMLRREYGRRFGSGDEAKPKFYSSEWRNGRPRNQPELLGVPVDPATLGPLFRKVRKAKVI